MQKILTSYLRRLSNLSGNNRSLLLPKVLKDQFIDIHHFDYVENEPSFQIIRQLLERKKNILLCSEIDSRSKHTNELSKCLKKIQRIEKFIFDERGAKDLYVGWPFVKGKFSDDTLIRCPLIFFPVAMMREGNKWFLSRRDDVNITLNKTFLLAYAYYNNVPLDEDFVETVMDEYDKDSIVFRTQLYDLLKKSGVEIHFNQENFSDSLKNFTNYNKSQLESSEKTGRLKMFPQAVLGIFPQAGSYLVPDYVKLIEEKKEADMEDFFLKKIHRENENQLALFNRVNEENTFTPFPLDAYQEYALKEIKKGNSLVVEGPPGTGKSQLISNLICDFVARGKHVLLVCQKKAALDVVHARLEEKNLNDFVALVHDFKSDRKPIYKQINQQIESIEVYKKKNNSLDAIQLERSFLQASRRIDQIVEELEEFQKALFDESECGKSVKELYLTSNLNQPSFNMNLEYRTFHFSTLADVERKFRNYLTYFNKFENRTHFWAKGPSFALFETKELVELQQILHEVTTFDAQLVTDSKGFCTQPVGFNVTDYLSGKIPELNELKKELQEKVVFKIYQQLHINKPTKDINWLTHNERTIMACFRGASMESTLLSKELGRFQEVLRSARSARKNPLSWLRWRMFSKEKTFLKRVLVTNKLKSNRAGFNTLVEKIDNRLNFEHSHSRITETPWLHNFPKSIRKIDIQDWFYWQKRGLNIFTVSQSIRSINELIPINKLSHTAYCESLDKLIELTERVPYQLTLWSRYINIHQVRTIILKKENLDDLRNLLKKDFDAVCEYHKLRDSLLSEEKKVLSKMTAKTKSIDNALELFRNSLSLAWINFIESKYPNLRDVTSGRLDALVTELKDQIEDKRKVSQEILLLKSKEKTYENIEYNRLKNRITYRDLHHQVTKKRRIWPIRKLISEFSDEIFTLLPCWMCSPESASAIFPMSEFFDLVIFDEASQCFAERGIPAMYRGKQILVTGDSMQLQPSDLYRVRWDDEGDDIPELSIDSLLDLTKHYLPQINLAGHYRSKSLELIDFSNENFYKGRLKLLPDYEYINKEEPAIDFVKSKGIWDRGVNEIEANDIVSITLDYLKNYPDKTIGIVTFNYTQQGFILNLLEEKTAQENILIPDSLFVKNIENVQGDERDIILFSITYATDKKGKLKLQFGSLNVEGGENRLNVAVTRAKEKIVVVSSLTAQQLKTDDTRNKGPKLLKKYLEYAWKVSHKKWIPFVQEDGSHHTDWFLRNHLQMESFHGFKELALTKELPFSDISVKKGKTYTGLILTDDELYYEALSIKQIYAFQYYHLILKNWPHVRFHSRELWLDRESAKNKIRKFLYSNG